MARLIEEPPLTEPLIVPCLYVTGAAVERADHAVRIVGWVHLPVLGGETDERRIVIRFAMPIDSARKLSHALASIMRERH